MIDTDAYRTALAVQPSLRAADEAAEAALDCARVRDIDIAVAIVDVTGHPLCVKRMERAKPIAAAMAHDKAWTAVMNRRDTALLQEMTVPGQPAFGFQHQFPGQASVLPGGRPIMTADGVNGAVGVSGADKAGDEACAEAAVRKLEQLMGLSDGSH